MIQIIGPTEKTTNESTTTDKETMKIKDNGIQMISIYILLGVAIIILAAILCVVIKIMKKKRNAETTLEENVNYGKPSDFEQYYEEEKNAKIVDTNDYYK